MMGLDDVFGKVEKPKEEKKIKVVQTEESAKDDLIFELVEYFEQSIPSPQIGWDEYFETHKQYLQSLSITPDLITKVNITLPKNSPKEAYRDYKGNFLSALIQTSYDQGFNDFIFREINSEYFGNFLQGKKDKKINIKAEKINGQCTLHKSENCCLEVKAISGRFALWKAKHCSLLAQIINGEASLFYAKYSSLEAEKINGNVTLGHAKHCSLKVKNLNGNENLADAQNCVAEITNHKGHSFGGIYPSMRHCKIYSPKLFTLLKLKIQPVRAKNNSFHYGKLR